MPDDSTLPNARPTTAGPLRARTDDRFVVENELARGGLGRILRARDPELGRLVALKVPLAASETVRRRFVREALLTARLQHPSIVPLYEAGVWSSGEPYYAMKLVEGRSLHELLAKATTLEERLALLPNLLAVAEAVAYAHEQRIIHRDLKPANVLVGSFGETVVLDWGLAKQLDGGEDDRDPAPASPTVPPVNTGAGQVMGTPRYMAPEQAAGHPVDERADVYALGAMLYELVGGRPPHVGDGSKDVVTKLLESPPLPLVELAPRAPRELCAICEKAMVRDPAGRYRSAKTLAEDLRRFTTGQLVSSYLYSPWALFLRFVRRHRVAFVVGAVLLLALAVTALVDVERVARARRDAERRRDELILEQARTAIARDPTATVAWLKQYSLDARDWREARALLSAADTAGVARFVWPRTSAVALAADGKTVVTVDASGAVFEHDLVGGRARRVLETGSADTTPRLRPNGDIVVASADKVWLCAARASCRDLWHRGNNPPLGLVDVSRDGRLFAAADSEGALWRIDLASGAAEKLPGHRGEVYAIEFSPDGKLLATGGEDKQVRILDVASGQARVLSGHEATVRALDFTPDQRALASTGHDGVVRVWDLPTGAARILGRHQGPAFTLAVSPDGTQVATSGADHIVKLWPIAGGEPRLFTGHTETVMLVGFSPDGHRLASSGEDQTLRVWNLDDGDSEVRRGHQGPVLNFYWSGDGKLLLSRGFDYIARLWDVTPRPARLLAGASGDIKSVAFAKNGWLAFGSWDGSVRLCAPPYHECKLLGRHAGPAQQVAFSPDGARLASCGNDNLVRVWDVASGAMTELSGHTNPVKQLAWSPDGKILATTGDDQTVRLWDLATGQHEIAYRHEDIVMTLAFSPDGTRVASGGFDHTARVYDRATHEVRILRGHAHWISSVAFSPDSRRLASGSFDGTVRLWNLADGEARVLSGHQLPVVTLAFSPAGERLASGSLDRTARVWNLEAGSCTLVAQHDALVKRVVFSPDGRSLATSGDDRLVRLWDLSSGETRILGAHQASVRDLAFSPDGRVLASAGNDHLVRLWDLSSGAGALPLSPTADRARCDALTTAVLAGDVVTSAQGL